MTRVVIVLIALVMAAAAPARAWCEATCLAPVHAAGDAAKPHCAPDDAGTSGTSISVTGFDDCPVVDSARPTASARLDMHAMSAATVSPLPDAPASHVPSFVRPHSAATVFERCTPLRI